MFCAIPSGFLRRLMGLALCAVMLASVCTRSSAADPLKDATSLKFVPDTVAFYSVSLRMREIFDKVAASRAVAKLQQVPVVQMGLGMAMTQWQNPQFPQIAAIKQLLADPQNQQLIGMLTDAVSHELFVYGGADFGEAIALINELNMASNAAQIEAAASGDMEQLPTIQFRKILEALDRRGDNLKLPALVIGAKLTDAAVAEAQLKRLETFLTAALAQQPALKERFVREQVAGAEFLTLRLDGSLVPWQMALQQAQGVDPQQLQQLITKLTALKLAISLGVRDGYLLVSLGDNNQHLTQLGQQTLLYDRAELAPIRAAANKPITGVTYASAAFIETAGSMENQLSQLGDVVTGLVSLTDLSDDLKNELNQDLDRLFAYVATHAPKPAAMSAYSFLTAEGWESFSYRWSTDGAWDASAKLTILQHLGGDPVAFWAARRKADPDQAEMLAELFTRLVYYAENIPLDQLDPDQRDVYAQVKEQILPLFDEMATVTRDKLVPAFADGQGAIVLDAKSVSDKWLAWMFTDNELPMLELGIVSGVSDAALVKEAFSAYFDIAQRMVDKLHELSTGDLKDAFPNEIPAMQLVPPQSKDVGDGSVYYYALPADSGLDAQLAPNAGLSKEFMVASLLPQFTARLLARTPLAGQGPLAQDDRPLAAAGHLDFPRLIDAIEPWIDYGLQVSMGFDPDGAAGGPMGDVPQQVHDVLQVIRCFRGVSSATYLEANSTVTHAQVRFADLEQE